MRKIILGLFILLSLTNCNNPKAIIFEEASSLKADTIWSIEFDTFYNVKMGYNNEWVYLLDNNQSNNERAIRVSVEKGNVEVMGNFISFFEQGVDFYKIQLMVDGRALVLSTIENSSGLDISCLDLNLQRLFWQIHLDDANPSHFSDMTTIENAANYFVAMNDQLFVFNKLNGLLLDKVLYNSSLEAPKFLEFEDDITKVLALEGARRSLTVNGKSNEGYFTLETVFDYEDGSSCLDIELADAQNYLMVLSHRDLETVTLKYFNKDSLKWTSRIDSGSYITQARILSKHLENRFIISTENYSHQSSQKYLINEINGSILDSITCKWGTLEFIDKDDYYIEFNTIGHDKYQLIKLVNKIK